MKSILKKISEFNQTCSCKEDPTKCLKHMFCDMVQKKRVEEGQCPARRPVFLRTHGIISGTVKIFEDLPQKYKQGIFEKGGTHPVYVRYSSDLADGRPDWKSTIGIGIKIFNVPGTKFVDPDATVADFILQNVPYFFVDTAEDMCNFTKASFEGWSNEWIQKNAPDTTRLLANMEKPIRSVFATSLWSIVPFKLGEDEYCKYIIKPGTSTFSQEPNIEDPDFLGKDLASRMKAGEATLDIYIQRRPNAKDCGKSYIDKHFPLDKATVIWDEQIAKPVKVATITLPQQDIDKPEQETYGDWLSFNIGRVPKANQPVGSIADARMKIYQTSAKYRQEKNGQPVEEPTEPGKPRIMNPTCPFPKSGDNDKELEPISLTEEQINRITDVRIHPGIGIARLGNSATDYTIGPEVIDPEPTGFGSTRDKSGAIKRQAARFRVYGYDKHGFVVAEIQQSEGVQIEWSVHVANKKAQWYEFDAAMDLPATTNITVPLRNADVIGSSRKALCIDPGETKITGLNMKDPSYIMTGNFQGTPVSLGELRTDSVGRLLVLGGKGISASPSNKPIYDAAVPSSFSNASGWYDDIADGPVKATIHLMGKSFTADSAWVCSTPPNYAPDVISWRSMNDLMRSVYMQAGMLNIPEKISFKQHVMPILKRLSGLQWVNKGFASMFGVEGPMDFNDLKLIKKLSIAPISDIYPDPYMELRRTIYNSFRPTNTRTAEEGAWPWIYGDTYGYTDTDPSKPPSPNKFLKLPYSFDYILSNWANGDFESDEHPNNVSHQTFDQINLQEQPSMLDQAAMHFCLADAFHPGAELTWPMRHTSMYRAPYRISDRKQGKDDPTYGSALTQQKVLAMGGPLYEQGPGDLTRWMALPWQGDTAFCRSGYEVEYDPYLPTYWPARVPNQVLTKVDYEILMDDKNTYDVRLAAFQNRASWLRQLPYENPAPEQMMYMVEHYSDMGIVEAKKRPDHEDFSWMPDYLYVENLTKTKQAELDEIYKRYQEEYGELGPTDRALYDAGWFSEEQRDEFARIKRRGR